MGLDVFFYLAKKTRERKEFDTMSDYIEALGEDEDKRFLSLLKKKVNKNIEEMKKEQAEWEKRHPNKMFNLNVVGTLRNSFYRDMKEFFEYDFMIDPIKKMTTIEEIEKWAKGQYEHYYKPLSAYFRKVNCIYKYFSDRLEQERCIVEKKDVIDIMGRAIRILETKDTELAERLLPTQGGFFFGPTEYDSWYFKDMEEILKEFGKLLNAWEDDDICYVVMSW